MDTQTQHAVTVVKVLKLSFIISGALFILITFRIPTKVTAASGSAIEIAISFIATMTVVAGFLLPKWLATLAATRSQLNATVTPLKAWVTRCIISLAFFDACNLFAVVLHFLGAHAPIVWGIFAMGMLSLIFWSPGSPPTSMNGAITEL